MMKPRSDNIPIVDGHLDLAENVTIFGRNLTLDVSDIRVREIRKNNQASVSLTELQRGGIAVAFATVTGGFREEDVGSSFRPKSAIYRTHEEAETQALAQIDLYEQWEKEKRVRIIKSVSDLEDHLQLWQKDRTTGLVLLMEGADPIVEVGDLSKWWQRGLRMIGLTFGDTRYGCGVAGGTTNFNQGGLTPVGFELLLAMSEQGFIWDISHLTEKGAWQGFEINVPHVCASHANAQALTPTNRHLSDEVIKAVAQVGGVIGLVLYNDFLDPRWNGDKSVSVSLEKQARQHAEHIANLTDWSHVGIGSDLDGGFGLEESPFEIDSMADLYRVGRIAPAEFQEAVLSSNWLNFLRKAFPQNT